jgi:hypothetical protein
MGINKQKTKKTNDDPEGNLILKAATRRITVKKKKKKEGKGYFISAKNMGEIPGMKEK